MKITIIGAGNMGGSTALGLAGYGAVSASDLTVTARHQTSLDRFIARGICATTDNCAAVQDADIVFYAVKPWQMEAVLKETAPVLDYSRQMVVSIAPGIKPGQLKDWLAKDGSLFLESEISFSGINDTAYRTPSCACSPASASSSSSAS